MLSLLWSKEHALTVSALHDSVDLFLPKAFIEQTVVPGIAATIAALTVVYVIAYYYLADKVLLAETTTSTTSNASDDQKKRRRKVCYQITNLLVNLALGTAGAYWEVFVKPDNLTVEQTVRGFEGLVHFSSIQLGYQLWALPMGILYVREQLPMLLHHCTVIFVASMSAFLTNGFRFHTPFFYGLIELSSVPLAIMNAFKDNPHLIEAYPTQYTKIRWMFALSFLYIRIAMFVPRHYLYLRDQWLLFTASDIVWYKVFMTLCWISSVMLLLLQMFWASLIVKGLRANSNKKEGKTA
jgi:TLC domain